MPVIIKRSDDSWEKIILDGEKVPDSYDPLVVSEVTLSVDYFKKDDNSDYKYGAVALVTFKHPGSGIERDEDFLDYEVQLYKYDESPDEYPIYLFSDLSGNAIDGDMTRTCKVPVEPGATWKARVRTIDCWGNRSAWVVSGGAGKSVVAPGEADSFLELIDTPSDYTDDALKIVRVNASENGLEFVTPSGEADTLDTVCDRGNVTDKSISVGPSVTINKDYANQDAVINFNKPSSGSKFFKWDKTDERFEMDGTLVILNASGGGFQKWTPSDGIYLEDDSADPTSSTLTVNLARGDTMTDGVLNVGAGAITTKWSVGVDLGSAKLVEEMRLYDVTVEDGIWSPDYDSIAIYKSDDNANWTLVETFDPVTRTNEGGYHRIICTLTASATARYWKMYASTGGLCGASGGWLNLSEVEAYGTLPPTLSHLRVGGTATLNAENEDEDAILYFGISPSGNEDLRWDKTDQRFEFSDDLFVKGSVFVNTEADWRVEDPNKSVFSHEVVSTIIRLGTDSERGLITWYGNRSYGDDGKLWFTKIDTSNSDHLDLIFLGIVNPDGTQGTLFHVKHNGGWEPPSFGWNISPPLSGDAFTIAAGSGNEVGWQDSLVIRKAEGQSSNLFKIYDSAGNPQIIIDSDYEQWRKTGGMTFRGNTVDNRVLSMCREDKTRYYGFEYSGNSLDFKYITGGVGHIRFNTDGSFQVLTKIKENLPLRDNIILNVDYGDQNAVVYFRKPTSGYEEFKWDKTNVRFELSDDLYIGGNLTVNNGFICGEDLNTNANIGLNWDQSDHDAIITFKKPTSGSETLRWNKTSDFFQFSNDLHVDTKITSPNIEEVRYADQFNSVQDAIDDLPANGGKVVVPSGIEISTSIILRSNVWIEGTGESVTIKALPGCDQYFTHDGVATETPIEHIRIGNFKLEGNGTETHFALKYVNHGIIENCHVVNSGIACVSGAEYVHNFVMRDCFIDGTPDTAGNGIHITHSTEVLITENRVLNAHGTGIFIDHESERCAVIANEVKDSTAADIAVGDLSKNVVIEGNIIEGRDSSYGCIYLTDTISNVTVVGNSIVEGNHGIRVEDVTDCIISGNIIDGCAAHGIWVKDGSRNIFDQNVLKNCGGWGIRVELSANECSFLDNGYYNNSSGEIYIGNPDNHRSSSMSRFLVGETSSYQIHTDAGLFADKHPMTEIKTGDTDGTYEEFVCLRHTGHDETTVLRRLGLLFKLSSEGNEGESDKMGGFMLETENAWANDPKWFIILDNAKVFEIDNSGNTVTYNNHDVKGDLRSYKNVYINYDGPEGNSLLYFYDGGSPSGASLMWQNGWGRFEFNKNLYVNGTMQATGSSSFGGSYLQGNIIRAKEYLAVNSDYASGDEDAQIFFNGVSGSAEAEMRWDHGDGRFVLDQPLYVEGDIKSTAQVWINADDSDEIPTLVFRNYNAGSPESKTIQYRDDYDGFEVNSRFIISPATGDPQLVLGWFNTLTFSVGNDRFEFNDDLYTTDSLIVQTTILAGGIIASSADFIINNDYSDDDAVISFRKPTSGEQTLKWDKTNSWFVFDEQLYVTGRIINEVDSNILRSFKTTQGNWWDIKNDDATSDIYWRYATGGVNVLKLESGGNVLAFHNLDINAANDDEDAILSFGKPTSGTEDIRWDKTNSKFLTSAALKVTGLLEGTTEIEALGGDFKTLGANGRGVQVKDKTTGTVYRIIVDNGAVTCEAV